MLFKKKCTICGAKNPKDAVACVSCGALFAVGEVDDQLLSRIARAETKMKTRFEARIEPERLRLAINQVIFAASSDMSKEPITGVSAEFKAHELTLAATDGFRLAVHKTSLIDPVTETVLITIPAADLAKLGRYLVGMTETVRIEGNLQTGQITFHMGLGMVASQLLKKKYPSYKQLIPSKYATRAVFLTSELSKVISSFPVTGSKGGQIVRLKVLPTRPSSKGQIVALVSTESGGESTAQVTAQVDGRANRIALNPVYLIEGLNAISEDRAALDIVNESSPGLIHPISTESYVYLIMPMFVQWS